MPHKPGDALRGRLRSRAVFVHSHGGRLFLGYAATHERREVSAEEVEALASAGFEIVQVDMKEGAPLCAALAALPVASTTASPCGWFPREAWTYMEP